MREVVALRMHPHLSFARKSPRVCECVCSLEHVPSPHLPSGISFKHAGHPVASVLKLIPGESPGSCPRAGGD